MPVVSLQGIEPQPSQHEGVVVFYEASCDGKFQPPNTLLKQEELQLAEASFQEILSLWENWWTEWPTIFGEISFK